MKPIYIFILSFLLLMGCKSINKSPITSSKLISTKSLTSLQLQTWHHKDYRQDNIPGTSLEKWYNNAQKTPNHTTVIVAVIDAQIDLKQEDLKGQIWTNPNEIANNGIDDDANGYIDDINGWNFIGIKNGGALAWTNLEFVRLVRDWSPKFKRKIEGEIAPRNFSNYKEFDRALKMLTKKEKYYKNWSKSLKYDVATYKLAKDTLTYFFQKKDYTSEQLDSLYKRHKINDKTYKQRRDDNDIDLGSLIINMKENLEMNLTTFNEIKDQETQIDSILNKNLNLDFDERTIIGDNLQILEKGYGNNAVGLKKVSNVALQDHGTEVSGIIGANRENNIGIKGILQQVKIMPLNISSLGDEHDKDIAMSIRYAVDNGAKVINMSFGKEFSLHKEWVFEAFKYAEEHNVLLVHVAGNDGFNIDQNPCYPSDIAYDGSSEVCGNFINVGSISSRLDSTFVSAFSNYGKQNVDLFAPGEEIYTTTSGNAYMSDSGTSLAGPMVSGTAALIWSYYPKLTVQELKQIILDSGTAYDIEVIVPGTKDKKVPFSELSKSGKVLNVYNAMQMAEKMSKKKRY
jgi:subtilisin family serine protease